MDSVLVLIQEDRILQHQLTNIAIRLVDQLNNEQGAAESDCNKRQHVQDGSATQGE